MRRNPPDEPSRPFSRLRQQFELAGLSLRQAREFMGAGNDPGLFRGWLNGTAPLPADVMLRLAKRGREMRAAASAAARDIARTLAAHIPRDRFQEIDWTAIRIPRERFYATDPPPDLMALGTLEALTIEFAVLLVEDGWDGPPDEEREPEEDRP